MLEIAHSKNIHYKFHYKFIINLQLPTTLGEWALVPGGISVGELYEV